MFHLPVARSLTLSFLVCSLVQAEGVDITPDVVYGHKFGMALTFDVFRPAEDANSGLVGEHRPPADRRDIRGASAKGACLWAPGEREPNHELRA